MSEQFQMTADVRSWLHGLCATDPATARLAGQAVIALLDHGTGLAPPLLTAAPAQDHDPDPRAALDEAYQHHLTMMTSLRRAIADIATARKRLEADLGQRRSPADQDLHAELRTRHTELRTAEEKLTADSQRLREWLDGFRARKEALKAAYTAAQAQHAVNEAYAALAPEGEQPEVPFPGADEAVSSARSAASEFLGIAGGLDRDLQDLLTMASPPEEASADAAGLPHQLLILRPGAPGCLRVRILLAARPGQPPRTPQPGVRPDRLILLAATASHAVAAEAAQELIREGLARYRRLRSRSAGDNEPEPASYTRQSFLTEFFPGEDSGLAPEAAALVAQQQPQGLAGLRLRAGLTQAQVAQRLGVRQERISALERGDPGAAEVRTLAAYVEALGGRLELSADLGTDRVLLG